MPHLFDSLLTLANRAGHALPTKLRRRIADFPGVLGLFERLSRGSLREITTPEGYRLVLNPLFHAYLAEADNLAGYEPFMREAIVRFTRPGMVAYDIGANVGTFSFLFAALVKAQGAVYAFEPERNNYLCLQQSIARNGIANLHLDTRAVGKSKGREAFDRRGGAFSGRLIGTGAGYQQTQNIEIVETVGIDELIAEQGFPAPDIVKIDVEGNELMVLQGMEGVLAQHGPVIICELHTHLGESSTPVIDLLVRHGYTIQAIDPAPQMHEDSHAATGERHIVAHKTAAS